MFCYANEDGVVFKGRDRAYMDLHTQWKWFISCFLVEHELWWHLKRGTSFLSPCSSMYSTIVLTNRGTSWPGWPLCCTSSKGTPNTLAVLRDSFRVRERLFLIASTATPLQSLCVAKTCTWLSFVNVTKTTTAGWGRKGAAPKQGAVIIALRL